jgi:hypothetical protein
VRWELQGAAGYGVADRGLPRGPDLAERLASGYHPRGGAPRADQTAARARHGRDVAPLTRTVLIAGPRTQKTISYAIPSLLQAPERCW